MNRLLVFALLSGCAGDCSDMYVRVIETDALAKDDQKVGLGLTLFVDVYVRKSGVNVNPDNLAVIADTPETVDARIGATPIDRAGQVLPDGRRNYTGKNVGLTPLALGDNGFVFIADNTDQTASMYYEAVTVDEARFVAFDGEVLPAEVTWWLYNHFAVGVEYLAGGRPVLGTEPIDAGGLVYEYDEYAYDETDPKFRFATGSTPMTTQLVTGVVPGSLTVHVVDITGLATFEGSIDGAVVNAATPLEVEVGAITRVDLAPFDAAGRPIRGFPRDRASVTVTGTAATATALGETIRIEGVEPGQATLDVTWGSAALALTVDVVPATP